MELKEIKGIGPKTLEYFHTLSINTIEDLITYYPYRYNIFSPKNIFDGSEGDIIVVTGIITNSPKISYIKRNFNRLTFTFETSNINTNVVIFNRAFLIKHLTPGKKITLIGKYNKLKNTFTANDIKLFGLNKTLLEPVYHKINGLKTATLIKSIKNCLELNSDIKELVPSELNEKYDLLSRQESIKEIHFPSDINTLKKAKLKLKYEELFEFMFKINIMKYKNQLSDEFVIKEIDANTYQELIHSVPFKLTNDQLQALDDIKNDFLGIKRMNRLIIGDVGSGKTIVSFLAILLNYYAKYQSALLAPTEVLARQHYENFLSFSENMPIKVGLLVGSMSKSEKKDIIKKLEDNEIDLLIGTHAMLSEDVLFNNIGLVVTDEQHRFGVNQRKSLQNKGKNVDVLYMSATPIPRTYALTIYGDMDISIIKEKPSGRKDIITKQIGFNQLDILIEEINHQLSKNHQVYIVAPVIEENDNTNLNDINKIYSDIKKNISSNYKIGILHGKMNLAEKEKIMQDYKMGKLSILIATTVIEVGVDVSNATLMVIFNAERFGLATLHQLRGRVGRNAIQSKCLLISDSDTERLKVMEESNDGFYISEMDFKLRGSGDLFGVRQSGDMQFKIANLQTDYKILLQCKKDAEKFIEENIENGFREYSYYQKLVDNLVNHD